MYVQTWNKRWRIGCVITASCLLLAAGGELTQPSLRLLFHVCTYTGAHSKCLAPVNQNAQLNGIGKEINNWLEKSFVSFVEGLLCSKVFLQLLVLLGPSAVAPLQINPRGEWGKNNLPPIDDHGAKPWSFRNTDYRGAHLVAEHCLLPSNTKLRHKITLY